MLGAFRTILFNRNWCFPLNWGSLEGSVLRFLFQIPPSMRRRRQINRVQRFHVVSLQGWTSISLPSPSPSPFFIFCTYLTPSCNPPPSSRASFLAKENMYWLPWSTFSQKPTKKGTQKYSGWHIRPQKAIFYSTSLFSFSLCFIYPPRMQLFKTPRLSRGPVLRAGGGSVWGVGRRVKQKKLKCGDELGFHQVSLG